MNPVFPDSGINCNPEGMVTEGESKCVSRQRVNAKEIKLICRSNVTDKLKGYQGKYR